MAKRNYVVKNPYHYDWITMNGGEPDQKRYCGEAIQLYLDLRGMSRKQLAELVAPYAEMFNTRFTVYDVNGYIDRHTSPKIDKLTALSKATGFPVEFWCGYKDAVIKRYANRWAA